MTEEEWLKKKLLARRSIEDRGYITPCWIWTGAKTDRGYGNILRYYKSYRVHRLAAKLWLANFIESLKVLHKCDIPLCFNPDHLFQGTQKDNVYDSISKGRHKNWGRSAEGLS
jgi:hypothetical protein